MHQAAVIKMAGKYAQDLMPAYTHLQRAQPVVIVAYLLSFVEQFERDYVRLGNCCQSLNVSPLGSGAVAGSTLPIDRQSTAKQLGFSDVSRNSIDTVGDRDFCAEFIFDCALIAAHLSRLAEDWIIYSSSEFGFIKIADSYCTSSSMMPQKRNPDVLELIRGKTGSVYGSLVAMLTVLKGQPSGYNRDLQEDKEGLFDTVDTLLSTLEVFAAMIASLRIKGERTRSAAEENFTLATDLADYLVKKDIPFRQAHAIVSKLVRYAIENKKTLSSLDIKEYKTFSPKFEEDVKSITVESSLASRSVPGGTAPEQVRTALTAARKKLQ